MAQRPWFKPKQFGYGYSPATWEGWLATAAYALVLTGGMVAIRFLFDPPPGPWRVVIPLGWTVIATVIFL